MLTIPPPIVMVFTAHFKLFASALGTFFPSALSLPQNVPEARTVAHIGRNIDISFAALNCSLVDTSVLHLDASTFAAPYSAPVYRTLSDIRLVTTTITVTSFVQSIVTHLPSTMSVSTAPTSTPLTKSSWMAPAQMTDLQSFNISAFPVGQNNLAIIPVSSISSSLILDPSFGASSSLVGMDDTTSSVLQLRYPANSINPANDPKGGAEFYASPVDITNATNVTLGYSVFFPADFAFVLGGKLPGLYGGHKACSGGDDARSCFSTRLMWRDGGRGELYLYAPKDKQTPALCSDPQSVCDSVYGLSIGRASFSWTRGTWTHVQQTVVLNTPGQQDGSFVLDVNGQRAIERHDIFYRDKPSPTSNDELPLDKPSIRPNEPSSSSSSSLLGSLLGGITGPQGVMNYAPSAHKSLSDAAVSRETLLREDIFVGVPMGDSNSAEVLPETSSKTVGTSAFLNEYLVMQGVPSKPIGFTGLFFSTFFGGHEPQYATPRDQYTYFKDFSIAYNA